MTSKKSDGLWKKLTGLWELNKIDDDKDELSKVPLPPHFQQKTEINENTSRTLSSNHTLHGKLSKSDLAEKGHNFDTTEVEMGKLGLHPVPPGTSPKEVVESYSNVDGATLTNLKIDLKKTTLMEELTSTSMRLLSSLKRKENDSSHDLDNSDYGKPDVTVSMALPRGKKWRDKIKISTLIILLGALIIAILYGTSHLASEKGKVESAAGSKISNSKENESNKANLVTNEILDSVNYQATGRGLVYNCKGHHWACIDKINYTKCRKLSKVAGKDCVTQGVYETNEICFAAQKNHTTQNTQSNFCN